MFDFLRRQSEVPDVSPDVVFEIFGWPISNSALQIFFILILVILFNFLVVRKFKVHPTSRVQHFAEWFYNTMVRFVQSITGSEQKARDIMPIVLSLFVFVGLANLINFIPGLTSITYNGVSIFRTPTSDFNTTFSMAATLIIFIQFAAIKRAGIFSYIGKFFQFKQIFQGFKKSIGEGFIAMIGFFVGLLDIISELAKMFSLSLRLFGNIYAGEVLLVVIFGALAFALPSLWMSLSLFFGVIQAIVFGALAAAYYASSVPDEGEESL
ncbi:MAG: FoF1 ATP synthase subunit a [bacterium]|nr:FoF1 ATP synthase subunit a [bacterium]